MPVYCSKTWWKLTEIFSHSINTIVFYIDIRNSQRSGFVTHAFIAFTDNSVNEYKQSHMHWLSWYLRRILNLKVMQQGRWLVEKLIWTLTCVTLSDFTNKTWNPKQQKILIQILIFSHALYFLCGELFIEDDKNNHGLIVFIIFVK